MKSSLHKKELGADAMIIHQCHGKHSSSYGPKSLAMWSSSSINGYTNWKDAINNFNQHERSKCHAESVFKMVTVPKTMKDLGECLSSQHAKDISERWHENIEKIAEYYFPCLSRSSLRGDGNEDDSSYIQLLNLRAIDNLRIIEWCQKKSDKYMSPVVQNQILKIMALKIIQKIGESLQGSDFSGLWQIKLLMHPIRNKWLFACDGWIITLRLMKISLGCMKLIPSMLVHCIKW